MAKVHVLETSFINNRIVEAGETIDYDGTLSENLVAAEEVVGVAETKASTPASTNRKRAD